jgi:hypothetical protein
MQRTARKKKNNAFVRSYLDCEARNLRRMHATPVASRPLQAL